jgi:alpha-glucosidase (family GH31 glycosyl hydrolase)
VHDLRPQTVCPSARHSLGSHYDVHNMYGFSEMMATSKAMKAIRKRRPFVVSRQGPF